MAVRARRSGKASKSVPPESSANGSVGWGIDAEGDPDDVLVRRTLFAVLVAVVACVGVWFMLDVVRRSQAGGRVLSAVDAPYTVCLMRISDPKNGGLAKSIADRNLKELGIGFRSFDRRLPDGRVAICAGGFDRPDSPEASAMVEKCRALPLRDGGRWFREAEIIMTPGR